MNIEIKEKFNNFVKIIGEKEQLEWLKQNNIDKNQDNEQKCLCEISSGYESINDNIKIKSPSINSQISSKIEYMNEMHNNEVNELSLLEDDYFITNNNLDDTNNHKSLKLSNNSLKNQDQTISTDTIKTEFKNIFKIDDELLDNKMIENSDKSETKHNLEKIYKKVTIKNTNNDNKKNYTYKLDYYFSSTDGCSFTHDKIFKKINGFIEYLFTESTRGWNYEHNIYILNFDKLKENLKKIIFNKNENLKIGYIYRDYSDPKIFLETDFSKKWIGYNINSTNKEIEFIEYSIKNKILFYCFKNLLKTTKFKKKIGNIKYKFIKKTIQVYGNKNLIIDIIFYIGIS